MVIYSLGSKDIIARVKIKAKTHVRDIANARLVALAPELLESVVELLDDLDACIVNPDGAESRSVIKARKTISRTRGILRT